MDTEKPTFIYRDGMIADKEYVNWLSDVKHRFQQSQLKAAVRVNTTMLEFYWSMGRDIVQMEVESKWGSGFFNQLSLDMKALFPNETGFSATNLKYMKRWYSFYYEGFIIRQQLVDELQMPENFGLVPWGHHICIISKCETIDEALFYINKTVEEGWSRSRLEGQLESNLYKSQGAAITNFDNTLPTPQNQLAKELLKDKYNLELWNGRCRTSTSPWVWLLINCKRWWNER